MSKCYLYSRVSTDQQTLEQQERTVYEWLNNHQMHVDAVVSDEGVSGGVSYIDRKLGKELLPMMEEGDMIIVSEISRLGRSMFDLSKLIHNELKPRKLRLVVCSMGIDLRCDKLTAIDELILNNFSFAAQLEKQLISERTLSALQVKRKQGVKFGSANEKYRKNYESKSEEEKERIGMKRGQTRNIRYLESRNTQAFFKILRIVFPAATEGEPKDWGWELINTRGDRKYKILCMMRDYKSFDDKLFHTWDFSEENINGRYYQTRLASLIKQVKRSVFNLAKSEEKEKEE